MKGAKTYKLLKLVGKKISLLLLLLIFLLLDNNKELNQQVLSKLMLKT